MRGGSGRLHDSPATSYNALLPVYVQSGSRFSHGDLTSANSQHSSARERLTAILDGFCSHAGLENLLPKLVERSWFIHMCVRSCPRQPLELSEMVNTLDTIDDTCDPIDLLLRHLNNLPVCRCTLLPNLLASKPDGKSGTSIAKADKPQ